MKTLNVGIIGFGFIGKVHAFGYLNLPLFYEALPLRGRITHVCTGSQESAERGRAQIDAMVATTDYRAITENPDIDIVHICSPNHRHKEALLSAMAHNKHIYCDKPLVVNRAEAEEIRDALPAYRGTAQMTLQNRFFPGVLRARQLMDEGFLGQVLEFHAAYLHSGNADPESPLKWKLSAEAGGGVIADLASHVLDAVHYLLGDYRSLLASTHIAYRDRPLPGDPSQRGPVEAEDRVTVLARMAAGSTGIVEATKIATGSEDEFTLDLRGSRGAIRFNSMEPHHLEVYDCRASGVPLGGMRGWTRLAVGQRFPAPASDFPGPKFTAGWLRVHAACLANFLQAIAEGRPAEPGLEQGIYLQHLIEVARDSARREVWVDCPPSTWRQERLKESDSTFTQS